MPKTIFKLIRNCKRPQIVKLCLKKNKLEGQTSWLQVLLQKLRGYGTYIRTYIEQWNRTEIPEINSHIWSNDYWQEYQDYSTGQGDSVQQMVLRKLNTDFQNNEFRPLLHTMSKNIPQMNQNLKTESIKPLQQKTWEGWGEFRTWLWQQFNGCETKIPDNKIKSK